MKSLAHKIRIKNEKIEKSLRLTEHSMTEDLSLIKNEEECLIQQIEDLHKIISEMKNQMSIIKICTASEKAKIDCSIVDLNNYSNNFDLLFEEERKLSELHNKDLRDKEIKKMELESQKQKKLLEMNDQKSKALAIECECEAIERECCILAKRNKAIMIKIRRKLIEAEEIRRKLQQI